ncbi:DUF4270 family protein [Carboxylicivirga marina]|uniref:DUF4270 family protein n=1 Tax=Carboxylicivirga marina TaxID=2800988 RepID=UPI0025965894|nr:DUF4270 family protein [uncultured Carboxylicivirga sp.]
MKKYSLKEILMSAGQLFIIGLLSLTVACKDEPARLTGEVLPDGEMIKGKVHDNHLLETKNIARTSVETSDATYGIIGEFNDPIFGQSKAAFLTDFSIGNQVAFSIEYIDANNEEQDTVLYQFNNTNTTDFPNDEWKVDSLVMNMQYQFNNWYGDMEHGQNVNIYELSSPLGPINQVFYSDHDVTGMYFTTPIASQVVHPNNEVPDSLKSTNWANLWDYPDSLWNAPEYLWDNNKIKVLKDSAWLDDNFNDNKSTIKNWRFKLNDEVRDRFFNMTESDLKSSATFKDVFNGIYVALDDVSIGNGNGWLTKVNLLSSSAIASNLTIHLSRDHLYMNSDSVINDTTSTYQYSFPINLENVRFNTYKHALNTDNIDITDEDPERLYIQGMAGSYMEMELPDEILNWVDSIGNPATPESMSVVDYHMVANIEFYMEVAMDSASIARYPIPSRLNIKWLDDKGELTDPVYSIVVNGNKVTTPVFGGDSDSQGNRIGTGERVGRYNDEGDIEYLYRFIMRADYFNYVMRNEDGAGLEDKQFFVGPESTTSNFQRVILYSGSETNEEVEIDGETFDKRMKMNIKYYQYRPR